MCERERLCGVYEREKLCVKERDFETVCVCVCVCVCVYIWFSPVRVLHVLACVGTAAWRGSRSPLELPVCEWASRTSDPDRETQRQKETERQKETHRQKET